MGFSQVYVHIVLSTFTPCVIVYTCLLHTCTVLWPAEMHIISAHKVAQSGGIVHRLKQPLAFHFSIVLCTQTYMYIVYFPFQIVNLQAVNNLFVLVNKDKNRELDLYGETVRLLL